MKLVLFISLLFMACNPFDKSREFKPYWDKRCAEMTDPLKEKYTDFISRCIGNSKTVFSNDPAIRECRNQATELYCPTIKFVYSCPKGFVGQCTQPKNCLDASTEEEKKVCEN